MTARSKTTIKSYFQTGLRPTQAQFVDLIDSYADAGLSPSFPTVVTADSTKLLRVSPTGVDFALGARVPTIVSADTTKIVKINSAGDGFEYGAKLPAFTASKFGAILVQNTSDDGIDFLTSQGTTGQILTSNGADVLPTFQTIAASKVTTYQITDATDISLADAPTQTNIGSTFSITVPTKGAIEFQFFGALLAATSANQLILGIRIGSTNYWPDLTRAGGALDYMPSGSSEAGGTSLIRSNGSYVAATSGVPGGLVAGLSIEKKSVPTGVQTAQLIGAKGTAVNALTIKGTTLSSIFNITVYDHS